MQTKICMITLVLFLFNFSVLGNHFIVSEHPQEPTYYKMFSGYKEIAIKGAHPIESRTHAQNVIEVEIGNIPLRKQIYNSCGPTSLAMFMDWIGEPYRTQEFYDDCVNRHGKETTRLEQLKSCANKLRISTRVDLDYRMDKLKTGDIVSYHAFHYKNSSDLHASVVDSIDEETIRLANPWNCYDEYTRSEFEEIYIKEALIR